MQCHEKGAQNTGTRPSPRRMNVAMYTPYGDGGHARYTHELLLALSKVGKSENVGVSLVTTSDLVSHYRSPEYPVHDVLPPLKPREDFHSTAGWAASRLTYYPRREREFMRWAKRNDSCESVHLQDYEPWLAPRQFRQLKSWGKKLFLTVHNVHPHSYYPLVPKSLIDRMDKDSMNQCDALFIHDEGLRGDLVDFLGKGHPPIFVTPHGVWNSSEEQRGALEDERRARSGRLLFFGAIRQNKGLDVLLRAMERLPGHELLVAGSADTPEQARLVRERISRLPEGRVRYTDRFVDDEEIPDLFAQSSLAILPYTSFTAQSGVLHDALAHRLPVVVSDVGALGESVRRWGFGEVVPPGDDAALARAISELLEPGRYAEAVRSAGRAREELSWDRTAEATIEAYRYVWDRAGARRK